MTRSEFMRCCAGGACCGTALVSLPAHAEPPANEEIGALKWKLGFARAKFAQVVELLNANVDEATRNKIFEEMGRAHGRDYREMTDKYKGNLEGFLEEAKRQWVESVDYDAKAGTLRIMDKAAQCTCPLVELGKTPGSFCECSLGWQKEVYSAITGRKVEGRVEESVLRGGKRCVFALRFV